MLQVRLSLWLAYRALISTTALASSGFAELLQIVLFHPAAVHSVYAEGPPDPADFTIRAPFPTVHLLREADVMKAVTSYPDTAQIPARNKAKLRSRGLAFCEERWSVAFYRHGHGRMKNTVSAIDTIFACLFLGLLRLATGISDRPMWEKLRWAIPPGVFVFLVITLSTWANFLSYQSFALSAPSELIFVWIFARLLQPQERRRPCYPDLPPVVATTLGTVLLSLAEISGDGHGAHGVEALGAALLCRAASALMMVSLRSSCVVLEGVSKKDTVSVVEIAYWKMLVTSCLCLPYAFLTEGLSPWRSMGSTAFWADQSSALLLSGSVLITMGFQWSTVGLNRSFRSPLCALLESTLKPLTACALVLVLADSPYQKILGLKQPKNATDIVGLCCLLLGLLLNLLTCKSVKDAPGERPLTPLDFMDDAMEDDDLAAAMAMSMEVEGPAAKAVRQLREKNSEAQLAEASSIQVLSTLLGNLVKSPSEEKYRRVKLSNKKISMALSCAGAEELLGAAGFAKTEDQLEVPSDSPPEKVKADAEAALEALSFVKGHMVLSAQLRAEGEVRCVTTLASGGLAFGSMDNLIRVYGAPGSGGFSQPRILSGHQRRAGVDGVLALVVMEGDQLVSAGRDGRIIVWKDGVEVADLKGHGEGIQGTNVHVVSSLATDGRSLISGGWDKTVRLWENQSQKFVMAGHDIAVNAVAGLSNGDIVSGSGDQSIGIWRNGQKVMTLQAKQVVRALCALDGSRVAAGSNDGFVRLWDASGKMLAERQVAQSYVLSLSRHGPELAAGCSEGQVVILSTEGLQVKEELQVLAEAYGLSFFPNGDLAVACGDGSCTVWTRSAQRAAGKVERPWVGFLGGF
ncbi:unnamed protein product [Cladocopium goreaui]|uniref:UBA domain-containing protein n=1 Tax=Cladocopium goreaui TaxID=2562237 RepID=A0A9P1FLP1_9DINO|nr:unnamed protein product [Cladocopium goreaui]